MIPFLSRKDDELNFFRGLWNAGVLSIIFWILLFAVGYGVSNLW